MLKMKKMLLSVVMAVFATVAYAQTAGDFNVTLSDDGKGVIVTGYTGSAVDVTIPSEIEGLPVREIRALRAPKIRSLVIPNTVTTIGAKAFSMMEGENIDTWNQYTLYRLMGGGAPFTSTTELVSITIPNSVTSIGKMAFVDNTELKSVKLPDNIQTIPESIFDGCSALASVTLPSKITSIGKRAFFACSSLKSINLPDSVTEIGELAFMSCESLVSINLPASITNIGIRAFEKSGLTSITIPANIISIPDRCFSNCDSLTSVIFNNKIQTIGKDAFANCAQIVSVTIPDNIINITASNGNPFEISKKLNLATQARLRNIKWNSSPEGRVAPYVPN
jgi:hypothetical protein